MSKTNYVNPFRLNALISFLFHCDGDRGIVKRRDLKAAWQGDSLGSAVPQDQLWPHSPVGKCMWQHPGLSVPKYSVYMAEQSLWMVSEHEVLDTQWGNRLCVQWMEAMLWTLLTKKKSGTQTTALCRHARQFSKIISSKTVSLGH